MKQQTVYKFCGAGALLLSGLLVSRAQDIRPAPMLEGTAADVVQHSECSFFVNRDKFSHVNLSGRSSSRSPGDYRRSALTAQVVKMLSSVPSASRDRSF